jgi:hypothetical protein
MHLSAEEEGQRLGAPFDMLASELAHSHQRLMAPSFANFLHCGHVDTSPPPGGFWLHEAGEEDEQALLGMGMPAGDMGTSRGVTADAACSVPPPWTSERPCTPQDTPSRGAVAPASPSAPSLSYAPSDIDAEATIRAAAVPAGCPRQVAALHSLGPELVVTDCGHIFHSLCLLQYEAYKMQIDAAIDYSA